MRYSAIGEELPVAGFDRARLRIAVVLLALPGSTAASAYDFKCPAPTEQVANDVKADLDGQAQALIGSGTAAVKGRFESTVVDLFSKYQNSDRVAIAQNFLGPACDFLKAANIPDEQKYERWLQIAPLVEKYFHDERPRNGGQSVGTIAGLWNGKIFYSDGRAVKPFTFTFDAIGCRGRGDENNTFGDQTSERLFSYLECPTNTLTPGQTIRIRKTYDGTAGATHTVVYEGVVSSDMREISGHWVAGPNRGSFVLQR